MPGGTRVACFIDGFNLYHAIDDLSSHGKQRHYLKWLDLRALANCYIRSQSETLSAVHYFSAYATWLPDAYARHREYVSAIQAKGVTVKLGQFKKKPRSCRACGSKWDGHEEKESDVNFAVELLNRAWRGEFDRAIIITADTDIVPVLQMVQRDHAHLHLTAAIPERRYGNAISLRKACHSFVRIKEVHLERSLLPAQIVDAGGNVVSSRPAKYTPPAGIFVPAT